MTSDLHHAPDAIATSSGNAGSEARWYALQTRAKHEQKISQELAKRGITHFLPTLREVHHWSDRRKVIEVPMFACYVFVRVVLTAAAKTVAVQVPGVIRFVGFNNGPADIPEAQIESIKTVLARHTGCSPHQFLRLGQRVRIRGGSLDGVEGILVNRGGDRKLVISIELIQQAMAIAIQGYDVEPL